LHIAKLQLRFRRVFSGGLSTYNNQTYLYLSTCRCWPQRLFICLLLLKLAWPKVQYGRHLLFTIVMSYDIISHRLTDALNHICILYSTIHARLEICKSEFICTNNYTISIIWYYGRYILCLLSIHTLDTFSPIVLN